MRASHPRALSSRHSSTSSASEQPFLRRRASGTAAFRPALHATPIVCLASANAAKRPILVTGGAGFIGSHVCEALLRRGDDVVLVDCLTASTNCSLSNANLEVVRCAAQEAGSGNLHVVDGSITDRTQMADAMRLADQQTGPVGVDGVVHLAARTGVNESTADPQAFIQTNVLGTGVLLGLAAEAKCKNFILCSSGNVYGERPPSSPGSPPSPFIEYEGTDRPISHYAATKRSSELLAHSFHHLYDMPVSVLRFFTVYGPRGRTDMAPWIFINKISQGQEIVQYGDGTHWRDFVYVEDVVQGILKALDTPSPYAMYNISGGTPVMLSDFIRAVERAVGKPARVRVEKERPGDVSGTHGDISRAREKLGYAPKVTLEEGLARTVEWYNNTHLTR